MPRFDVAQEFIERTQALQNEDELFRLMEEVTIEMGFRYFALIRCCQESTGKRNASRAEASTPQ
jgi:hypothetical protein